MKKFLILLVSFVVVGLLPALPYTDDSVIFGDKLAEGVGRTFAVALLSCLGLLYKPNKNLGFGIAAAIFSILTLYTGVKYGTL